MSTTYMQRDTENKEKQHVNLQIHHDYLPYGKVLIVDDKKTNLCIASSLLLPYGLEIDTAENGHEVIEKIKNGADYDIIFMDHKMPLMDGIETTYKLRDMGYTGIIILLTADIHHEYNINTEYGQHGFDDYVSKPIDLRHINSIINKYIRDNKNIKDNKNINDNKPGERSLYNSDFADISQIRNNTVSSEYISRFCLDAKKALKSLCDSIKTKDIKLLITTVHIMKLALADIGENEISKMAYGLEVAGLNHDWKFITDNCRQFIIILEVLMHRLEYSTDVA